MDVREAARRTLAAGSARVAKRVFFDPPPTHAVLAAMETTEEGVVDLTRRRARLETFDSEAIDALEQRITSRWPWLGDAAEDDEDDEEAPMLTVFIGGRRFLGDETWWTALDDNEPATCQDNPTWVLDALAGAGGARPVASEEVRGADCKRYELDPVDLRAAVETAHGAIAMPPHGHVQRPTLRGDVWVDADGLVRRVTWIQPPRGRPRLRPSTKAPRLWRSIELWDFGLPVVIDVPDARPMPKSGPLPRDVLEIGAALWRMRRDYRRRRSGARSS